MDLIIFVIFSLQALTVITNGSFKDLLEESILICSLGNNSMWSHNFNGVIL
jgi:hypothetical protein